jgi:L-lactate dehydrogenase complex protein LldE
VAGGEVVSLSDECCGFGGTFAVRYDEVSSTLLADRLNQVAASGADTLVVTDPGCLMHLDGGANRRGCAFSVRHLAEVLADDSTANEAGSAKRRVRP